MNPTTDREAEEDKVDTRPRAEPWAARVLVADDDEAMRLLVTSTLEDEGYQVNEAISGSDLLRALDSIAVDAWPTDGVDLIVLDLRMPGMNGLDVVRRLQAAHWFTPTILMTAFAGPEVIAEAARLGVPVLSKPFGLDALTQTAGRLLSEHATDGRGQVPRGVKLSP
jgi:CheY-like chemotaxis protein